MVSGHNYYPLSVDAFDQGSEIARFVCLQDVLTSCSDLGSHEVQIIAFADTNTTRSAYERMAGLPTFEEIKDRPGLPRGCAWGLWDKTGMRDELGTLNLLTEDTVRKAGAEIRQGVSVSLK